MRRPSTGIRSSRISITTESSAVSRLPMATKFLGLLIVMLLYPAIIAAQSADYVIGAQDILMITSFDQDNLSGKYPIDSDGTFTFPLIGRIKAGGLTLRQLENELKRLLQDGFFKNPQLSVGVELYRSQK